MAQHILNGACSDGACLVESMHADTAARTDLVVVRVCAWCQRPERIPSAVAMFIPDPILARRGSAARKAGALLPYFGLGGDCGPVGRSSSTASARAGSRPAASPPLASSSITIDPSSGFRFGVSFFELLTTISSAFKAGALCFLVARFEGGITGSPGAVGINVRLPARRHGRRPL
jgi:hypothetical protein